MSITDELREWASVEVPYKYGHQLTDIADRIDAEHQKAMNRAGQLLADAEKDRDYNYANWQECKQKVLQHNITIDELYARTECLEDELREMLYKAHIYDEREMELLPDLIEEYAAKLRLVEEKE